MGIAASVHKFDWPGQLVSLQSVSLRFDVRELILPESIGRLTQMTPLHVQNWAPKGHIRYAFAWSRLVALEVLKIIGLITDQSAEGLSSMASLVNLKSIAFVRNGAM